MATATMPRLRQDLVVTPLQDPEGVTYFDVNDPRTGGSLRLYDVEWWVAERLDGQSTFEELSRWIQEQLGFEATPQELEIYAQRLQQLGFFDVVLAGLPISAAVQDDPSALEQGQGLRSTLPGIAGQDAAVPTGAQQAPEAARAEAPDQTAVTWPQLVAPLTADALQEPGRSEPVTPAEQTTLLHGETPGQAPSGADAPLGVMDTGASEGHVRLALSVHSAASASDDDVMGKPLIPSQSPASPSLQDSSLENRPTLLLPTVSARHQGADGLEEDDTRSTLIEGRPTLPLHAVEIGTTSLGPVDREGRTEHSVSRVTLPPAVSSPIVPAEQIQRDETEQEGTPQEAYERSQVIPASPSHQSPGLPIDLSSGLSSGSAESATGLPTDDKGQGPSVQIDVTDVAGVSDVSPGQEAPRDTKPLAGTVPAAQVQKDLKKAVPVESEIEEGRESAGAGRWLVVFALLIALGFAIYFFLGLKATAVGVQTLRVQPHQVTRSLPNPVIIKKGTPVVLKMEAGGLLASVISEGAEVSAGMSLAVLQSQAKLQKDVTDLRERLSYYGRRLEMARDKGDEALMREAQAKVNEKQERLSFAEANLKKGQLLAPRSGKVTRVLVSAGEMITPGSEVVEIADNSLGATLVMNAADAGDLKVGQKVQLQGPSGVVTGSIVSLTPAGDKINVDLDVPDVPGLQQGAELRLVKGWHDGVIELPQGAITEGDTVYVLSGGKASRRKVTIVDHEGGSTLVSGLNSGDEVIVSNLDHLRDGQVVKPVVGSPTGSL